jgi:NAD-dependent SIR2 family protein deacetylase
VYDDLAELVSGAGVVILSGAGISTESGIPDYRGPTGSARPATPMTFQAFTGSQQARQRYWARAHLSWPFIARAAPNAGHVAVADLQASGLVAGIVTQNVDGLHQAAGATDVLELHGGLDRVECLTCGERSGRDELDVRLKEANPGFVRRDVELRPDGDAAVDDVGGFHVVDCLVCGGLLKPDVVFFGETVPRDRVDRAFDFVDAAASLLVLGSSLTVMSGYRFVLRAAKQGIPVAIVNQGPTRGDGLCSVRVDAPLGEVLTTLLRDVYPNMAAHTG